MDSCTFVTQEIIICKFGSEVIFIIGGSGLISVGGNGLSFRF